MKRLKWPKRAAAAVRAVWNPVFLAVLLTVSVFPFPDAARSVREKKRKKKKCIRCRR